MNKKVLTLCAGVLLVGGSAIFTVNAMNAGNEKVQSTYVATKATDAVAGYELVKATDAVSANVWSLVKKENKFYLSPVNGYYLAANGSITSTPAEVKLLEDGSISFDGKNAYKQDGEVLFLWENGAKVTTQGEKQDLCLATSKTKIADFVVDETNGTKISYISSAKIAVGSFSESSYTNIGVATWTFDESNASLRVTEGKTSYGLNASLKLNTVANLNKNKNEAKFEYKDSKLYLVTLEGTELKKEQVYLTATGTLTTTSETEGAEPVVFYEITDDNKVVEAVVENAKDKGKYILAQGTTTDFADVKYVTEEIASAEAGAPGAEYGNIPGVVFLKDGTLDIVDNVTTAKVPVYIYYTVDKVKYYLTPDKGWSKDVKTVWTLVDGNLVSVAEEPKVITGVTYVKDGVIDGIDKKGHNITIALSQTSLMADEINECEYPLLNAETGDYVMLGGQMASGVNFFITQPEGQQAKFIQYVNESSVQNAHESILWEVTKQQLNDGRYSYIFKNRATKEYLNIDGYKRFIAYNYNSGVQLLGVDVNGVNEASVVVTSTGVETSTAAATIIGFYQSKLEQYTAHWLLHRYGSSFQLNFQTWKNYADKTWMGNEFNGNDLVPVVWDGTKLVEITPAENDPYEDCQAFLLKKRGTNLYIALNTDKKWSNIVTDLVNTGGYKFELLSEENVKKVLKGQKVENCTYMPYFRINYLEGETDYYATNDGHDIINNDIVDPKKMDPYCIEVGADGTNWSYDIIVVETDDNAGNGHKDLFVTVNDRCANDDRKPVVSFHDEDENIVRGEDETNNPLNYRYVNISFKAGNNMQFENEKGAMVNLNDKVLGMTSDGASAIPNEAEYFLFDKAEGQWAVSMTDAGNGTSKDAIDTRKFTFTNRENPNVKFSVTSMHYMGNNTYAVESNEPFGYINGKTQAQRDTLVIKAAEGALKFTSGKNAHNMDSYANWTKEELQDKTFQLSIDAAAQLYVTENEGKDSHFLGLTADETEVTNWRLVPFTAARVHDVDAVKYLTAGTDSVYTMSHPQYHSGGKFYEYNDTTAIITYALQNIQNNEWLTYDPSQNQTIESMICDPNSKNFTTANLDEAYRFVLKEKAEGVQKIESGAYNILGVNEWKLGKDKYVEGNPYYTLDLDKKLYGATSYQKLGAVEVEGAYEQPTSNDIFTIATTASQEYVKATPMDTVRIFGAEENDFLLYEKGQFLNMGNKAGIAPAMVLDTAYYNRPGNNRYQYLLVVEPKYVPADSCDIVGHPALHPDTMYGRFLVNKIDSAVLASRSHNNPYINDIEADEKELKLGFQWGYRTGDKLYLTAGKDGKVIETIDLSTPDFNKAKFAFKYVNEAVDKQFKVQTAWYDYDSAVKAGLDNKDAWTWNNEGYLRSVNGVIVVTNGYTHGEEFLMAQENSDPTANEEISAGNVVVAGVDGAVVVKGAEGKNVIVSTILGKVVANEVLTSDNAQIAAPAGIVVVSVDGESFKVVVK